MVSMRDPLMATVLALHGINYYEPLTPQQILAKRAEREKEERRKCQLSAVPQTIPAAVVTQVPAQTWTQVTKGPINRQGQQQIRVINENWLIPLHMRDAILGPPRISGLAQSRIDRYRPLTPEQVDANWAAGQRRERQIYQFSAVPQTIQAGVSTQVPTQTLPQVTKAPINLQVQQQSDAPNAFHGSAVISGSTQPRQVQLKKSALQHESTVSKYLTKDPTDRCQSRPQIVSIQKSKRLPEESTINMDPCSRSAHDSDIQDVVNIASSHSATYVCEFYPTQSPFNVNITNSTPTPGALANPQTPSVLAKIEAVRQIRSSRPLNYTIPKFHR